MRIAFPKHHRHTPYARVARSSRPSMNDLRTILAGSMAFVTLAVLPSDARNASTLIIEPSDATSSTIVEGLDGAPQSGVPWDPAMYPAVFRNESAVSVFNTPRGSVSIADPYEWLRETTSQAARSFVKAQQAMLDAWRADVMNAHSPEESAISDLIIQLQVPAPDCPKLYNSTRYFDPSGRPTDKISSDGDLIYIKLEKQIVFFNATSLGYTDLGAANISQSGANANITWLYVFIHNGASDWGTIHLFSVDNATREAIHLDETLNKVLKSDKASWTPDGEWLLYQYWPFGSNHTLGLRGLNSSGVSLQSPSLQLHRPNSPQSSDIRILSFPDEPTWHTFTEFSPNGRYLAVTISNANPSRGNKLWGLDLTQLPRNVKTDSIDFSDFDLDSARHSNFSWIKISNDGFQYEYTPQVFSDDIWTIKTDHNATNYMIVKTNVSQERPMDSWDVVIPEDDDMVLTNMEPGFRDGTSMVYYRVGLESIIQVRNASDQQLISEHGLPETASPGGVITKICGNHGSEDFYFIYSTQDSPGTLYRAHVMATESSLMEQTPLPYPFNTTGLKSELHEVISKDGEVHVPLLILLEGNVSSGSGGPYPTILYGYGGQNTIRTDVYEYRPDAAAWVLGFKGVYAVCLPRGGGDLGKEWWGLAHGVNKSKTTEDFISCAEYLIANNFSCTDSLVIEGASNGGLLMGLAVTKVPGLFTAVLAECGTYDLLHLEQNGENAAVNEYGNATDPRQFDKVLQISPLHNIRQPKGTQQYPAMLVTHGTADDRVKTYQTYKFVAQLQDTLTRGFNSPQWNPIIMRTLEGEGHTGVKRPEAFLFASLAINATWQAPDVQAPDGRPGQHAPTA